MQADDAPEFAQTHPPFDGKEQMTQPSGVFADLLGLEQNLTCLARGVKHPLLLGQDHRAGAIGFGVGAQQPPTGHVAYLNALLVDAYQHLLPDGRWASGVAAVVYAHTSSV
jgi:hypothetical protein